MSDWQREYSSWLDEYHAKHLNIWYHATLKEVVYSETHQAFSCTYFSEPDGYKMTLSRDTRYWTVPTGVKPGDRISWCLVRRSDGGYETRYIIGESEIRSRT